MRKLLSIVLFILAIISFIMFFITRNNQEYTIIFDSNGGSIIENQKVKYHKYVIKPENPTRKNYAFKGWQKNGVLYDFNTKVEENTLLTAAWEENTSYIVTITLEGVGYESRFYEGEVINIENYTLPPKDGYKIVLYNENNLYEISTPVTSNLNLVAKYEKNN